MLVDSYETTHSLHLLVAAGGPPPVRTGHGSSSCDDARGGILHIKTRDKSESPRPRAVWIDPGHGPGEVSPDLGPTPRARPSRCASPGLPDPLPPPGFRDPHISEWE